MGKITRHPEGISTAKLDSSPLVNFPFPDPTKGPVYFNHFTSYISAEWTETNASSGVMSVSEEGGWLTITNGSSDDNFVSLQQKVAAFKPVANKKLFFAAKFKVSDATQSDLLIGLVAIDTSPLTNTDGIYFTKADGATGLSFVTNASSTASTVSSLTTVVADTEIEVAFVVNGTSSVDYYVGNNTNAAKVATATTNIPAVVMSPTILIQNGEGASKVLKVDYILAAVV
jgi:hypothetical protein